MTTVRQGMCRQAPPSYNQQFPKDARLGLHDYFISADGYRDYVKCAQYERFNYSHLNPGKDSLVFIKKSLEHFIALDLLEIVPGEVYVDVASCDSPTPWIYQDLRRCVSFQQDLSYPAGMHGERIGGDAAAMPLADAFVSKMGLHSSFEHFEGDADGRFLRECERLLRPGGRVCIVEFFMTEEFINLTDPNCWKPDTPQWDDGAVVHHAQGWRNRFGRFYDWDAFNRRIVPFLGALRFDLYNVLNAKDFHRDCGIVRAAIISKSA